MQQETIGLQLNLLDENEFSTIMYEIVDLRRSQDKMRKKLFQQINELQKMCDDMKDRKKQLIK